jgi:hypothetical protein
MDRIEPYYKFMGFIDKKEYREIKRKRQEIVESRYLWSLYKNEGEESR